MNPTRAAKRRAMRGGFQLSEFDQKLTEAEEYFGGHFPGNEGLTCLKCGAAVNHGWTHIEWHKEAR